MEEISYENDAHTQPPFDHLLNHRIIEEIWEKAHQLNISLPEFIDQVKFAIEQGKVTIPEQWDTDKKLQKTLKARLYNCLVAGNGTGKPHHSKLQFHEHRHGKIIPAGRKVRRPQRRKIPKRPFKPEL